MDIDLNLEGEKGEEFREGVGQQRGVEDVVPSVSGLAGGECGFRC